jgi:ABC-type bacteriocin/lantibiotic exporter with double-glycine peptidase domain
MEFAELETESAGGSSLDSAEWPTKGDVELKGLCVRYQPHLPMVLKGVSLRIAGGESVGVYVV